MRDKNIKIITNNFEKIWRIEAICKATSWSKAAFAKEITGSDSFCYSYNNLKSEPVAYILFRKMYDELHLMSIAVLPEYRKKGIAGLLLDECVNEIRTNNNKLLCSLLEVSEKNHPAISLYKQAGFKKISLRKNYYKNGDNAIVMQKIFKYVNA